jgi:hypothetical protein
MTQNEITNKSRIIFSDRPNSNFIKDEFDRIIWIYRELPCLMLRGPLWHWCGYVGVPPTHPHAATDYDEVPVSVHGGLTYGEPADIYMSSIKHPNFIELLSKYNSYYIFGFDCAHFGDRLPNDKYCTNNYGEYRDERYAMNEVLSLADQLIELGMATAPGTPAIPSTEKTS